MGISLGIPSLDLLKARLKYGAKRQQIISANISNVDIPHAVSMDLKPFSTALRDNANRLKLSRSSPKHFQGNDSSIVDLFPIKSLYGIEPKFNGNNINMQSELFKVNANNLEYQQTLAVYGRVLNMLKTVLPSR